MKYYKNTELAKLYNVSEKTIRNWVQSAQENKLGLLLYEKNGKSWIANTSKNIEIIEKQVKRGKKFKNGRGLKKITPSKEFYQLYDNKQILDIISNLAVHSETPL